MEGSFAKQYTILQNPIMAVSQWLREGFQPLSLLAAIIFLLVLIKLLKSRKYRSHLPPGPPAIPIIGNLHQLDSTAPHLSLKRLRAKYGPIIYLQLGEIPIVVVSSARLAKEIMTTHDLALAYRPQLFAAKHLFYDGANISFSPYGPYWRNIKKMSILELLSAKRVQAYSSIRKEEVARLVSGIAEASSGIVDLTKLLALYANVVLTRTVFGKDFSQGGDYHRFGFQNMLEEYQILLGGMSIGEFFPSMEFIYSLTGLKSRLESTFRRFDRVFDQILSEHAGSNEKEDHDKDFVDLLLEVQKKNSNDMPLKTDQVKSLIMDMFTAGSDTTFISLDWTMTELVMNPLVLKKAQKEVRGIVGERKEVLESDLPHMHYMKAIIKEVYRFHPPAPILVPRESHEDITIDGYKIPAKTRFYVNVWTIGRDPESWEDPETFKPERFLGSEIDFKGQDFELLPFGGGRRGCPGINFGTAVVELALAQLLHSFDWELPPGIRAKDLDLTEVFGISMHRRDHLHVVAKPHFP